MNQDIALFQLLIHLLQAWEAAPEDYFVLDTQLSRQGFQIRELGSGAGNPVFAVGIALLKFCEASQSKMETLPVNQTADADQAKRCCRSPSFEFREFLNVFCGHSKLRVNSHVPGAKLFQALGSLSSCGDGDTATLCSDAQDRIK